MLHNRRREEEELEVEQSLHLRRTLAAADPRWLLLSLLFVVALAGLRLDPTHLHMLGRTQPGVRPPQMPRRSGLVVALQNSTVLAVGIAGQQRNSVGHSRTLSFDVCGGFAQQRIALLSGIVLAVELDRTMVLPGLLAGGVLDVEHFVEQMRRLSVSIALDPPHPAKTFATRLGQLYDPMKALSVAYASKQHLRVDCPALKLPPKLMVKHEELLFAAMQAMQPTPPLLATINMVKGYLQSLSDSNTYNALELRTENDWIAYCSRWKQATVIGNCVNDNCMNNTATVGDQLALHRVEKQVPLLLLSSNTQVNSDIAEKSLQNLQLHSYHVILRDELLGESLQLPVLSREELVMVDYHLALDCHQFVGNSVSVSSALLIMQRWHASKFATYYNGGNIPLEAFMPLYKVPWVFTYNDWSAGTEYDYMVKAAVTSGVEVARMKPYCMYSGSTSGEMYQWFLGKGVTIIQHEPAWRDALVKEGARNKEQNLVHSHLYKTGGTLVGTFQRIDIPILRQFDQYNYVLFTDCDVYFRQQMKLVDWGTPLPMAVGMGYEGQDAFPYNAGIMLMNVPYMRKTNTEFLNWILSQKNGLFYPGYGPLDQGAFNQFYEKEIKGRPISKVPL